MYSDNVSANSPIYVHDAVTAVPLVCMYVCMYLCMYVCMYAYHVVGMRIMWYNCFSHPRICCSLHLNTSPQPLALQFP